MLGKNECLQANFFNLSAENNVIYLTTFFCVCLLTGILLNKLIHFLLLNNLKLRSFLKTFKLNLKDSLTN